MRRVMKALLAQACLASFSCLALEAMAGDISEIRGLLESEGYSWIAERPNAVAKLSSDAHIVEAYINSDGIFIHRDIVIVERGSITQTIHWGAVGFGIRFEVLDLNSDGRMDLVASDYYEPDMHVKVFFNSSEKGLVKVFEGDTFSQPKFVDVCDTRSNKDIMEIILYFYPYGGLDLVDLRVPVLHVFDGAKYVEENAMLASQKHADSPRIECFDTE